jgi:hypothetical protein
MVFSSSSKLYFILGFSDSQSCIFFLSLIYILTFDKKKKKRIGIISTCVCKNIYSILQ